MTEKQRQHLLARIMLITAATFFEESTRELMGYGAYWRKAANGKLDKSSQHYLENKASKALKESKQFLATLERLSFVDGQESTAQEEIYTNVMAMVALIKATPEQKEKVKKILGI